MKKKEANKVPPKIVEQRKAEVMLLLFGPDSLIDWQRIALNEKYGTWDMHKIWLELEKKGKEAENRMWLRKCDECFEEYDPRTHPNGIGYSWACSDLCWRRWMVRRCREYPRELKDFYTVI